LIVSFPGSALIARAHDPWRLMLQTRLLARLPFVPAVLLPFLPDAPQAPLFVALVLCTAAPGNISGLILNALIPDLVPAEGRSRVLGGWFLRLGAVSALTTLVGGWVLERTPFPLGYQALFLVGMLGAIIGLRELARVKPPGGQWSRTSFGARGAIDPRQWSRPFKQFLLMAVLFQVGYGMGVPLLSIYWVRDLHLSDGTIGLLAGVYALTQVASYPVWGRLGDRVGGGVLLQASMLGLGAQLLLSATSGRIEILAVAALIGGFGFGGLQLGLYQRLIDLAPPRERLGYVVAYTILVYVALLIGPMLGSQLAQSLPSVVLLATAGAIRVIAPALALAVRR
jgi:MFS family permease